METISASKIRAYKSCLKLYDFQYNKNIVAINDGDALTKGRSYHEKIDQLVKEGEYELTGDVTDAMMYAFEKYIFPKIRIKEAEKGFEHRLTKGLILNGYFDGIDDNNSIVEHKTTGQAIDESYIHSLNWDEQVAIYMLASKTTRLTYTVIQKPTIRLKQTETQEEYIERCKKWYDESPETRTAVFPVIRSADEIKEKRREIVKLAGEMRRRKFFYRNPSHCRIVGCPYQSICLDYDPEMLINFKQKEPRANGNYQS